MLVFRSGCVPGGEAAKLRAKLRASSPRNHPAVNRSHFDRERGTTIAKLAICELLFEVVEQMYVAGNAAQASRLGVVESVSRSVESRHLAKEFEQRAWSRLLVQVLSPTTSSYARGCTRTDLLRR